MNLPLKAAAAAFAIAPVGAVAATIDFTTGALPGGVSVSAVGGPITQTAFDGAAPVAGLASVSDGLGVGDDEITTDGQSITVDFGSVVSITGLYFLDLFISVGGSDAEAAFAEFSDGTILSFTGVEAPVGGAAGFLFAALDAPILATSVTFSAGVDNDGIGFGDFALAGIDLGDVMEVPLPASGVLLALAISGIAYLGRRRQLA